MEEKELLSGSELMEKSMQSAIAESGATPSTGITVDGQQPHTHTHTHTHTQTPNSLSLPLSLQPL